MALCPDCKKRDAWITSHIIDEVQRCGECDTKKRKELNIVREGVGQVGKFSTGFQPYWLEHGPMSKVENDPNFDKENRRIRIKNKKHENSVCKEMNIHFGEKGETIGEKQYTLGDKPPDSRTAFKKTHKGKTHGQRFTGTGN